MKHRIKIALAVVMAATLAMTCCGCNASSEFVKAERLHYDSIAPRHQKYLEGDVSLDKFKKAVLLNELKTWDASIKKHEESNGLRKADDGKPDGSDRPDGGSD